MQLLNERGVWSGTLTGHLEGDITSEGMYRMGSFYIIKFSLLTFEKAENSSQRSLASF